MAPGDSSWTPPISWWGDLSLGSCVGISKTKPSRFHKEPGGLLGLSIFSCSQLCFTTAKGGKAPSTKGRRAWGEVWGKHVQGSEGPFPVESHRTCSSVSCDNMCEVLSARKAHQRLRSRGFYWGADHVGTVCLAHTRSPDCQNESRYSA